VTGDRAAELCYFVEIVDRLTKVRRRI